MIARDEDMHRIVKCLDSKEKELTIVVVIIVLFVALCDMLSG